jgi:hypothetical protein
MVRLAEGLEGARDDRLVGRETELVLFTAAIAAPTLAVNLYLRPQWGR